MVINSNDGNDTVARMSPVKERGFWPNFRRYTREYSEVTGIHGLRYVTEKKRSRVEKIFWVIVLVISLAGCIYMICEILDKYHNSPVVVSFASEDTPLYQIPFPAVTICPELKYSKEEFNYTDVYLQLYNNQTVDEEDLAIFQHLSLVCDMPKGGPKDPKLTNKHFFDTLDWLKPDPKFLFPMCDINGATPDFETLFKPVITDQGVCYSFNIMDRQEIYRDHVYHYKDYHKIERKSKGFFNIENGYAADAGVETYPQRALMSGAMNSLTVFFQYSTNDSDFACNTVWQGFRVAIHSPWDIPHPSKHFFPIPFSKVVMAAMEPEMITTSQTVRRFSPEKRKCFMTDERPLEHFRFYSQSNCLLECLTNYTLSKCGCVEFNMPRNKDTPICGLGSDDCVGEAEDELKIKELEAKVAGGTFCDCKPACTNLIFNTETSFTDFYFKEYFKIHPNIKVVEGTHWSLLTVYFKDEQFMTKERNELYGISDLISNLGGLLGLFTGFSLISAIELIYFCSLRMFYNERIYGIWAGPPS